MATLVTPCVLLVCAVFYFGSVLFTNAPGCYMDLSILQMVIFHGCPHADSVSWLALPPGILLLPALVSAEKMFGRVFSSEVRNHVR